MSSPEAFRINDRATLAAFMRRHSFATLVTHDGSIPHATHLPVLLEDDLGPGGTLVTRMARANPQERHFEEGREVAEMLRRGHPFPPPSQLS
jgi:transcriptional regulator